MMTRDESLKLLQNRVNMTTGEFLKTPGHFIDGFDQKDREFFVRHADEQVATVAKACQAGRVWPGDDSLTARKLRV